MIALAEPDRVWPMAYLRPVPFQFFSFQAWALLRRRNRNVASTGCSNPTHIAGEACYRSGEVPVSARRPAPVFGRRTVAPPNSGIREPSVTTICFPRGDCRAPPARVGHVLAIREEARTRWLI